MDKVGLAGTIGTWVAVFLALVALIAVVGPVLVWLAGRSERNKAMDTAGGTDQPYISRGFHFLGTNVRLFRRVRAPVLDKEPESAAILGLKWDLTHFHETKAPATWIQLAGILRGYGSDFPLGKTLVINSGKATLPVHRTWILVLGLLGRYTGGSDRPSLRKKRTFSVHTDLPKVHFESSGQGGLKEDEDEEAGVWKFRSKLTGLSGIFKILVKDADSQDSTLDSHLLSFAPEITSELGKIDEESISAKDLLMLAVGCISIGPGQYCALKEFASLQSWDLEQDDNDMYPDRAFGDPQSTAQSRTPPHRRRQESFWFDDFNDLRRQATPSRKNSTRSTPSVNKLESQTPYPMRLEKIEDIEVDVTRLAKPFGGIEEEVLSLEAVKLDPALSILLKEYMATTFVPPSAEWVRVHKRGEKESENENPITLFIWRAHAQKIAHGLLSIPWHPEGYLIGGDTQGASMNLLTAAVSEFAYILVRLKENVSSLTISEPEKRTLTESLGLTERHIRKGREQLTRASYRHFYDLDKLLSRTCHQVKEVNDMFGVLMITNEEFASLIRQSARHFAESVNGVVEVDLRSEEVKVPIPFGGVQAFRVDLGDLYRGWTPREQTVDVKYTFILLACLRACLRSFLLSVRFDGFPLMREILKMDEVVHVA